MAIEPEIKTQEIEKAVDVLTVESFESVEFFVGNAYQSAFYYQNALGFKPVAWSSLKTGNRKYASYVMAQNDAKVILSAPYHPISEMSAHHLQHGDGVKRISLNVRNLDVAVEESIVRGAELTQDITELRDDFGSVRYAEISTYGDVVHRFIEKDGYDGPYIPGYQEYTPVIESDNVGLLEIDHIVGNVELSKMDPTVQFYHSVFGFGQFIEFSEDQIATKYSALRSKVVRNYNHRIKMPINEPAPGLRKSQIEEYLDFYHGAGVQHIAYRTDNIIDTIASMRSKGVEFLHVPDEYYEGIEDRIGHIDEDIKELAKHGIMIDRDDKGYLLQLFSRPIQDRPTFFFEVIQRHGAEGFGLGNFKALFESLEKEQEERGNL